MRAAFLSARSSALRIRNLHKTTRAESSSMALSPPNARSAGLRALHAADNETAASTLIQAIVMFWIR